MAESSVGVRLQVDNGATFRREMGTAAMAVDNFGDQTAQAGTAAAATTTRVSAMGRVATATGGLLRRGLGRALTALKYGFAAAAVGLAVLVKNSIEAAGDLGESLNKASVTFGRSRQVILKWSKTTARALGTSRRVALEAAAGYGQVLKASGLAEKESALMSRRMVTLAADMASFHNLETADALDKIRAGLVGEAEPLRQVGVLLSEARMQEEAYRSGIAKRGAALTDAQKVQARYNLILKDTSDTHGDFAKTAGSMANQQRIVSASYEDLSAKLGKRLLPLATKFFKWANREMPGAFKKLGRAIDWITGNWSTFGATFGTIMEFCIRNFRRMTDLVLRGFGHLVDTITNTFGWLPHIGDRLQEAQDNFHDFQRRTLLDLKMSEIGWRQWDLTISERLRHAGAEWRKFSNTVASGPGSAAMAPFSYVPPAQRTRAGGTPGPGSGTAPRPRPSPAPSGPRPPMVVPRMESGRPIQINLQLDGKTITSAVLKRVSHGSDNERLVKAVAKGVQDRARRL